MLARKKKAIKSTINSNIIKEKGDFNENARNQKAKARALVTRQIKQQTSKTFAKIRQPITSQKLR